MVLNWNLFSVNLSFERINFIQYTFSNQTVLIAVNIDRISSKTMPKVLFLLFCFSFASIGMARSVVQSFSSDNQEYFMGLATDDLKGSDGTQHNFWGKILFLFQIKYSLNLNLLFPNFIFARDTQKKTFLKRLSIICLSNVQFTMRRAIKNAAKI